MGATRTADDAFGAPESKPPRSTKRTKHIVPKKNTNNKKKAERIPSLAKVMARPFCYYCERDFDDHAILLAHQKAKHFKCTTCARRLNTAGGLRVHLDQVHKTALTSIDNALPDRKGPEIEIFGAEGIPEEIIEAHNRRIRDEWKASVDKLKRETGNGPPGSKPFPEKRALEDPEKLRERLAIYKNKKAEEAVQAAGAPAVTSRDKTETAAPEAAEPKKSAKGAVLKLIFENDEDSPDQIGLTLAPAYHFDRVQADRENVVKGDIGASYTGVVGGTNEAVDHEMSG